MRILILEDNIDRIDQFLKNLKGVEVSFTDDVDICISLLGSQEWDVLFLDHDLNGNVYVPSDGPELTGWHVAKFLNENKVLQPPEIIIHSLNPIGAKKMKEELPNAKVIQFAWKKIGIEIRT